MEILTEGVSACTQTPGRGLRAHLISAHGVIDGESDIPRIKALPVVRWGRGFEPGHFAPSPTTPGLLYVVKFGPLEGNKGFSKNVINHMD